MGPDLRRGWEPSLCVGMCLDMRAEKEHHYEML